MRQVLGTQVKLRFVHNEWQMTSYCRFITDNYVSPHCMGSGSLCQLMKLEKKLHCFSCRILQLLFWLVPIYFFKYINCKLWWKNSRLDGKSHWLELLSSPLVHEEAGYFSDMIQVQKWNDAWNKLQLGRLLKSLCVYSGLKCKFDLVKNSNQNFWTQIPVCTLSPIFGAGIVIDIPLSTITELFAYFLRELLTRYFQVNLENRKYFWKLTKSDAGTFKWKDPWIHWQI